jgi:hypothetical protein
MLVACRVAGLSALETHYAGGDGRAQAGPPQYRLAAQRPADPRRGRRSVLSRSRVPSAVLTPRPTIGANWQRLGQRKQAPTAGVAMSGGADGTGPGAMIRSHDNADAHLFPRRRLLSRRHRAGRPLRPTPYPQKPA